MSLKFTFGGASPDQHDHGGAPSGIPLPFAGAAPSAPVSTSNVLELRVSRDGDTVRCAGVSGDGVTYATAQKRAQDLSPAALAAVVRSALARAGAELPEPLLGAITGIVLELGELAAPVLTELDAAAGTVTEALQARTGIAAGTPIALA